MLTCLRLSFNVLPNELFMEITRRLAPLLMIAFVCLAAILFGIPSDAEWCALFPDDLSYRARFANFVYSLIAGLFGALTVIVTTSVFVVLTVLTMRPKFRSLFWVQTALGSLVVTLTIIYFRSVSVDNCFISIQQ